MLTVHIGACNRIKYISGKIRNNEICTVEWKFDKMDLTKRNGNQ